MLARTALNVRDAETYGPAYDLLARAGALVRADDGASDGERRAECVRCAAGALHNLAGTLCHEGRYGPAARFLREGCALGARALAMWRHVIRDGEKGWTDGNGGTTEKEKGEEGWRQLEAQLFRRWELLGVCYVKIGERRVSRPACVERSTDVSHVCDATSSLPTTRSSKASRRSRLPRSLSSRKWQPQGLAPC